MSPSYYFTDSVVLTVLTGLIDVTQSIATDQPHVPRPRYSHSPDASLVTIPTAHSPLPMYFCRGYMRIFSLEEKK